MVYRDDQGRAALDELIRSEPSVLDERRQLRARVDELQRTADDLAATLAEEASPGVLAKLGALLGATAEAGDQGRAEHDRLTAQLAELVEAERALDARLATIADAKRTRDAALSARGAALRAEDSPAGEELRELDAAIRACDARLAVLDDVLRRSDRAHAALDDLVRLAQDVELAGSATMRVARTASVFSDAGLAPGHAQLQGRLRDQLPDVQQLLRDAAEAAHAHARQQAEDVAAIAVMAEVEPLEESMLCRQDAITALDALVTELSLQRRAVVDQRADHAAHAAALIADR